MKSSKIERPALSDGGAAEPGRQGPGVARAEGAEGAEGGRPYEPREASAETARCGPLGGDATGDAGAGLRDEAHRRRDIARWSRVAARSLLAGVLLALTLPLTLAAVTVTVLTSRGPAFYAQRRVGRGGRLFTMYKIRTMDHDSERASGPRWASPDDPRVTWAGRFLRSTHIDELPQLWNVMRGDMGFVGPRPERPEIMDRIEREIPSFAVRTTVDPGITGLAQLLQGPDADMESVRRKLVCDHYYVRRRGFLLDCKIFLATPFRVAGLPSRLVIVLFRLPGIEECRRFGAGLEGIDPLGGGGRDRGG